MTGYFLYHSIGVFHGKERALKAELDEYAERWTATDDGQWGYLLGRRQAFLTAWARLLGAEPGHLTHTENVTGGLYSVIGALPEGYLRDRTVLVAADCFPSLHFLLTKLAVRFGFTLRTVPLSSGSAHVTDDDFVAAWDDSVALALVTWVSSTSSHRVDLDRIAETARAHRSLVALDITQGAGLIPFQVSEGIAFTVSTSLKWLCGSSGAGILHVRPDLIDWCEPELRGWFSQPDPFNWDLDAFSYAPDARRFDHGTPSVLGAMASLPGIDHVLDRGSESLWEQNQALTAAIRAEAAAAGWPVLTPSARHGGSVMIDAGTVGHAEGLIDKLRTEDLFCDHRGPILRISPGMVCDETDVSKLLRALRQYW